jgi:CoA:oxalate CoA-transferase
VSALDGLRVLDLTRAISGPYCTMLLADMGADVIKVEPPEGDFTRLLKPFVNGESVEFMTLNRNKRSIGINFKRAGARELYLDLVREADIVVENFRPGVVQRLGVDYETSRAVNPRVVYCSISGFGQTGPYRDRPAYDIVSLAIGGPMSLTGEPGGRPMVIGIPIGDLAAGVFAAFGILAAIQERHRTGAGQFVDLAMLDVQVSLLTYLGAWYLNTGEVPQPRGAGNPRLTPYGTMRARDGYFALAVWGEEFWVRLCRVLELDELVADPRFATNTVRSEHRPELMELIEQRLAMRDVADWLEVLEAAGVPCAPINTLDRTLNDPQVLARDMVVTTQHPRAGRVPVIGNPIKLSGDTEPGFKPAPALGEHTDTLLKEVLGYSRERIAALRREGVLVGHSQLEGVP